MSMAWEVTDDDIELVLEKHGVNDAETFEKAKQAIEVETDRIEGAVLEYTDFDDQVESANDEIENILIEEEVITGEKKFSAPDADSDEDEVDEDDEE